LPSIVLSNEEIKKKLDEILYSGIQLDQIIILEAELLAASLANNSSKFSQKEAARNDATLKLIQANAVKNSKI
jgi:hypothetical protein